MNTNKGYYCNCDICNYAVDVPMDYCPACDAKLPTIDISIERPLKPIY